MVLNDHTKQIKRPKKFKKMSIEFHALFLFLLCFIRYASFFFVWSFKSWENFLFGLFLNMNFKLVFKRNKIKCFFSKLLVHDCKKYHGHTAQEKNQQYPGN